MGRKKSGRPRRPVTINVPIENYEVIRELAELRGCDVSAVLNQVIAEQVMALRMDVEKLRPPTEAEEQWTVRLVMKLVPGLLPSVAIAAVRRVRELDPRATDESMLLDIAKAIAAEARDHQASLGNRIFFEEPSHLILLERVLYRHVVATAAGLVPPLEPAREQKQEEPKQSKKNPRKRKDGKQ